MGGPTASYYLDIPLSETLGRHTTKPIARQITEAQLTDWYLPHDTVPALDETILSDETSLDDWLCQVLTDTRLLDSPLRSLHATWDAPVNASRWR